MKKRNQNILSKKDFLLRVIKYSVFALLLIFISLFIGVLGYHYFADLNWLDSLYNASMILTGMGPVDELRSDSAKWFASFYAIFSGVMFLSTVATLFAPFAHRLMHLLHVENDEDK